ncbi:MAG: fibronectin type III domain-containing protein, partial [Tissierellia bacterium]|nr:fibronectin type III domain-containing protein [Tissierellia bacterium]
MLDNQKKSLYKGLSMLLAIILLIHWTAPAGITQGYSLVDEIPEARESLDDQGLGPLGEFESGEELDTNPLQEEPPQIREEAYGESIGGETDGSEQSTNQAPVWPEDSTITLRYSTQTAISISWPEAIIETSDDLNYVISVCQSVYQSEQYIVENFLVGPITEYTVEDLLPGVEYRFDIEAVDERGQYSEILSGIFSTLPLDDEPPSEELPVSTDNISDESIGDESDGSEQNTNQAPVWPEDSTINLEYRTQREISITWTEAQVEGSDVVDYFVSVYQGDLCIADKFPVGTIPEYIAYNLSPGLEYRFDIQAYYVGQFSEVLSGTFSTSP